MAAPPGGRTRRTRPGLRGRPTWAAVERRGAAEGPSSVGCLHSRRPGSASRATRRPKRQNLKRYLAAAGEELRETRSARLGRAGRAGPAAPPEAAGVAGRPRGGAAGRAGWPHPRRPGRRAEAGPSRGGRGSEGPCGRGGGAPRQVGGASPPEALEKAGTQSVRGPWPARDAVLLSACTVGGHPSVVLELSSAPRSAGDRGPDAHVLRGGCVPQLYSFPCLDPFLPSRIP